jgi:tryptophan synthase beta chain
MNSEVFLPAWPGESPDGDGYFGAFGGKFIPEALVAAVDEVAIEYERAKADPGFAAILVNLSGRGDKDMDIATRYVEQDAGTAKTRGDQK